MVLDPYGYWEKQRLYNVNGLSWNSVAGIFMVFSSNAQTTNKIMKLNGEDSFKLVLHPNGWKILGDHNIAFKTGEEHKLLRKSFLSLFTRKALGVYLKVQERIIRESLAEWFQDPQEQEIRFRVRDMNVLTSQQVFCGPYFESREQGLEFNQNYQLMAEGFLSFPIDLPGTGLNKAMKARHRTADSLTKFSAQALEAMSKEGVEPVCLLDFWALEVLQEIAECEKAGLPPPKHSSPFEMGNTVLDFLFASQDASTASLTWIFALLDANPDVLAKIREEQKRIRPNDDPLTYEVVESLVYTKAVVKELLRYRPPATFVPQMAMADVPLTDDYTVPKGTLVVPSLWAACHQGFPNPEKFDPERMMPERKEDVTYRENFLTFGVGPHSCVGKEYAINHLIAFVSIMSMKTDWTRRKTPKSEDIAYLPTIYPAECLVTLQPFA